MAKLMVPIFYFFLFFIAAEIVFVGRILLYNKNVSELLSCEIRLEFKSKHKSFKFYLIPLRENTSG